MVLPTVLAEVNYYKIQNAPVDMHSVREAVLIDLNGKEHSFTIDNEGEKNWVSYFIKSKIAAKEIGDLPKTALDQNPFVVTLKTAVKSESFQLYMSNTPSLCYIMDSKGVAYQFDGADAEKFLESQYAESMYSGAKLPTLTLEGEEAVLPVETKWAYKAHSSKYVPVDTSDDVTAETQTFSLHGGLAVNFDILPDLCSVKIIDSATGAVYYEDVAANLSSFRVEKPMDVLVEVTAKWYEDASRDYYGESKYSFAANVSAPAAFYVIEKEMDAGEFISLAVKNVTDVENITFQCYPDMAFITPFFTEGEYAYSFLHIPVDAAEGDYKITLTYGSTVYEDVIKVNSINRKTNNYSVDASAVSAMSEASVAEFDALVKELTANASDKRLFEGAFSAYPFGYPYSLGALYGSFVTFNGDTATSHVNMGVAHKANYDNSPVPALNAGVVVYAGSTAYSGNTVVVDHGFGIMTWYRNMGEISVQVGQSVAKDEKLGVTGTTGAYYFHGVNIAMSVGNKFVTYYDTSSLETQGEGGIYMKGIYEPETTVN